jgi:hypothetical protein
LRLTTTGCFGSPFSLVGHRTQAVGVSLSVDGVTGLFKGLLGR